jgi:hypothetical protein
MDTISIRIVSDAILKSYTSIEMIRMKDVNALVTNASITFGELRQWISQRYSIPIHKQVLWNWNIRLPPAYRVDSIVTEPDDALVCEDSGLLEKDFYVQEIDHAYPPDNILIFIKLFDEGRLRHIGSLYVPAAHILGHEHENMLHLAGLGDYQLVLYKEVRPGKIAKVDQTKSLLSLGLRSGDILIIEKASQDAAQVVGYLEFIRSKIALQLCHVANQDVEISTLQLNLLMTYSDVQRVISDILNAACDKISLFTFNRATNTVINHSSDTVTTLRDMITFERKIFFVLKPT